MQSLSLNQVINIVLSYIIARYTCEGIFAAILHWHMEMILLLLFFILNCLGLFVSHKFWSYSSVVFLNPHYFCSRQRNSLPSSFDHHQQVQKIGSCYQTNQPLKDGSLSGVGWYLWRGYWFRHKSPGFRQSLAIHCCTQLVWAIDMELNMESSIFRLLIPFWESPW